MDKVKLIQSMSIAEIFEYEYNQITRERNGVVEEYVSNKSSQIAAMNFPHENITARPFEVRE